MNVKSETASIHNLSLSSINNDLSFSNKKEKPKNKYIVNSKKKDLSTNTLIVPNILPQKDNTINNSETNNPYIIPNTIKQPII